MFTMFPAKCNCYSENLSNHSVCTFLTHTPYHNARQIDSILCHMHQKGNGPKLTYETTQYIHACTNDTRWV